MSLPNPYVQYQQNAVQSASPGDLLVMLYDGLIKFLRLAKDFIEKSDISGANDALKRAQDIISYLDETLDERFEMSKNLSALYEFMARQLVEANIKKDSRLVQEILDMVLDMRNTWQQAAKMVKTQVSDE